MAKPVVQINPAYSYLILNLTVSTFIFIFACHVKRARNHFYFDAPLGYDKKKKHIIHVARSIKLQTSNMKSLMWLQNTCCSGLLKHS